MNEHDDNSQEIKVYLNLQVAGNSGEPVLETVLPLLEGEERVWVFKAAEYGHNAALGSAYERVVGHASVLSVRILCDMSRAGSFLVALKANAQIAGTQWQVQALLQSGQI